MSCDDNVVHRCDKSININIDVLGSDDQICISYDKSNKELSDDNEIFLKIQSVVSLGTLDDVKALYTNNIAPHGIMRIPVPKCAEEMNTPCLIMISELIG